MGPALDSDTGGGRARGQTWYCSVMNLVPRDPHFQPSRTPSPGQPTIEDDSE